MQFLRLYSRIGTYIVIGFIPSPSRDRANPLWSHGINPYGSLSETTATAIPWVFIGFELNRPELLRFVFSFLVLAMMLCFMRIDSSLATQHTKCEYM